MSHRAARDRDPRDDRARPGRADRREPVREERERPAQPPRPSRAGLNEFFVDGEGIHREVLQREICKYLGPEAFSRPSVYNGIEGYVVTAVRPFTPKMLDDLVDLSEAYVNENREMRRRGHQDISYGESQTSRQQDAILRGDRGDTYAQDRYEPQPGYTLANAHPGYPAVGGPPYPVGPAYPQGPVYTQGSAYPSGVVQRPAANEPNYTYSDEYGNSSDPYRQPGGYVSAVPREVRVDPRVDPRAYPRGDPRLDPRGDTRLDPRDPRADPRTINGYPTYVSSPGEPMRDDRLDYVAAPPAQAGRGLPVPSRGTQPNGYGHDSRDSPQMRSTYRSEPIREERRRR